MCGVHACKKMPQVTCNGLYTLPKQIRHAIRRSHHGSPSPLDAARAILTQSVGTQAPDPALAAWAASRGPVPLYPAKSAQRSFGVVRRAVAQWHRAHFDVCNGLLGRGASRTHRLFKHARGTTVTDLTQTTHGIVAEDAPEAFFCAPIVQCRLSSFEAPRTAAAWVLSHLCSLHAASRHHRGPRLFHSRS